MRVCITKRRVLMGRAKKIKSFIRLSFILGLALAICFPLDHLMASSTAILLVLQLAVIMISFQCGTQYAYMAAFLVAVSFNFLFTHPRYSLHVIHAADIINLTVFILVALIASKLADHYKNQQRSLEQVQLRNRILLSVSHDFRTPLATIIGTLTTLKAYREKLSEVQVRELLDSAIMESHRLHQYIENLLQATKIQYGILQFKKVELSVAQVIYRVMERLPDSRHRILFENNNYIPLLMISQNLIEQAVFNIIDNALRYSPNDKNVSVTVYCINNRVFIDIYDESAALTIEQSKCIFELFYSTQALNQNDSGMGLGFAVAKGIIKAHRGTIEAIPDGTGCQYRITLPLEQEGHWND